MCKIPIGYNGRAGGKPDSFFIMITSQSEKVLKMKHLFRPARFPTSIYQITAGLLLGCAVSDLLWVFFLQWHTITTTRIVLLVALTIGSSSLSCLLVGNLISGDRREKTQRLWSFLFAITFAVLLMASLHISPPSNVLFTPVSTLEVQAITAHHEAMGGQQVVIKSMRTELGNDTHGSEVSFNQFEWTDGWVREGTNLRSVGIHPTRTRWEGRAGTMLQLVFRTGPIAGDVDVYLNGEPVHLKLYTEQPGEVMLLFDLPHTLIDRATGLLSIWVLFSFIIYLATQLLTQSRKRFAVRAEGSLKDWLYGLPIFITGMSSLLAFWPGIISQDTIQQWGQMLSFQIESWHSPFHTLTIWLLTRLVESPAFVLAVQVLVMSLAVAWGLRALSVLGVPRQITWSISLLFAIWPVNWIMTISLWKDIPYGIAFFLLSVQILKIVFSDGRWVQNGLNWLGLGISTMMVGLYRHNGIAVAISVLVLLVVVYRSRWKKIGLAAGVCVTGIIGVIGPIYSIIGVDRQEGYSNVAFLYQIGAHYAAGTAFAPSELEYLEQLLPFAEWDVSYDPCTVNPITFNEHFDTDLFLYKDTTTLRGLFVKTLLRDPLVNLRHIFGSGSLVWEINPSCYLYYSSLDYYETDSPPFSEIGWVIDNPYGLYEDSQIPRLAGLLFSIFYKSRTVWLIWRPAVYFFWILFVCVLVSMRYKRWQLLLLSMPVLVQSGILLVVNIAQDFRYQYGLVLVGILFTGLLFMRASFPQQDDQKHDV